VKEKLDQNETFEPERNS